MNNPWEQTYRGRAYYFLNPSREDFEIGEIAVVLSRLARFNGHSRFSYSVAQHSVLVSKLCRENPRGGLMHDVHEMFMGDMVTSLKDALEHICPGFRRGFNSLCDMADELICEVFDVKGPMRGDADIKLADLRALATEKRDIMASPPAPWIELPEPDSQIIRAMTEIEARDAFLERYRELWPDA